MCSKKNPGLKENSVLLVSIVKFVTSEDRKPAQLTLQGKARKSIKKNIMEQ